MYSEYILIRYVSRSLIFKLEKARRCGSGPHLDTGGGGGGAPGMWQYDYVQLYTDKYVP